MNAELPIETQIRLQALLAGGLDESGRQQALAALLHDPGARAWLAEMIQFQAEARKSLGYETVGLGQAGLASVLAMARQHSEPAAAPRPSHRLGKGWVVGKWAARAAAAAVIGVSLYLAVTAHRQSQHVQEQLVQLPRPAAAEISSYRRIWSQVADGNAPATPWVLLTDGGGQFGYVGDAAHVQADSQLLLLRCVVLGADGATLEKLDLMLPAKRSVKLLVPEAGRLGDQPVRYEISMDDPWATVGVMVGSDAAGSVGVRGKVRIGGTAIEVGQFELNGAKMRVIIQIVPFHGGIG